MDPFDPEYPLPSRDPGPNFREFAIPFHPAAGALAAIVNSTADAVITKRLDGTIITWNRGAERLFGYYADEILGHQSTRIVGPDRYNEERDILQQVGEGVCYSHLETIRRRRDGSLLFVSATMSPVRSERGTIIGASEISRDITRVKERELNASTTIGRLHGLFQRAPAMTYQMLERGDGTICMPYVSKGLEALLRLDPMEVAEDATPFFRRIVREDQDQFFKSFRTAGKALSPHWYHFRADRGNRTIGYFRGEAAPEPVEKCGILWHGSLLDLSYALPPLVPLPQGPKMPG